MQKKTFLLIGLLTLAVVATVLVLAPATHAGSKVEDAIAKTPVGTGKGQINPDAPKGVLGIPGAPQPFWLWCILWGIWVGWIFSTVGAFGGIMAGVGHTAADSHP